MAPKKKRKKKKPLPKARHVWSINPKTRVKDSKKSYKRGEDKKKDGTTWVDDVMGWDAT